MKRSRPSFFTVAIAALALLVLFGGRSLAQDTDRYVIRPVDVDAISNAELRLIPVAIDGRDPYQSIDRPEVGANLIATELTAADADNLRATRPDLIVELDRFVEPNSSTGGVPWSIDRLDQRVGTDSHFLPDFLDACGPHRPYIYICDTGVLSSHSEFTSTGGRVTIGNSYIPALLNRTIPAWQDPYDHGTAVAGCAVGRGTGAGRGPAELVSAVCYPDPGANGGTFASFAADVIYWSLSEHLQRGLDADPYNDASVLVFASSTTNGPSAILDGAVEAARLGGMMVVVSAGNSGIDAAGTSPGGASGMSGDITFTVAASSVADMKWANSNYGARVELFAPGEDVLCASTAGANICNLRSGTSYSAGYVAGAAARILSRNPWATPDQLSQVLTDLADPEFGPSGPFPGPFPSDVPKLLYVHPTKVPGIDRHYVDWIDLRGLPGVPETDDSDSDGLSNAVEYVCAMDPTAFTGEPERPWMSMDGGFIHFHFTRANYLPPTVHYEIQWSTDCVDWTAVQSDAIMRDADADCHVEAARLIAKIPASGHCTYVRLAVLSL